MTAPTAESVMTSIAGGLMIVTPTTGLSCIIHPPTVSPPPSPSHLNKNPHKTSRTVSSYQLYFSPKNKRKPIQSLIYHDLHLTTSRQLCMCYMINLAKAYLKTEVTDVFISFTIDQSIKLSSSWASYSE